MLLHEFINFGKGLNTCGGAKLHNTMGSHGVAQLCRFFKVEILSKSRKEACAEGISRTGGVGGLYGEIGGGEIALFAALADVCTLFAGLDDDVLDALFKKTSAMSSKSSFPAIF